MIDGIKIKCIGTRATHWENSALLKFGSKVDVSTGEVLSKNQVAFYRGLSFHLIPSTVFNTTHCIIKGSLATYHNHGENNAFDFDFSMLRETVAELCETFHIDPKTAVLQRLEYGANIQPTQSVKTILRGLRAYEADNFTGLKMENVFNGKQLHRQEYAFKIYDKGLQTATPSANLLRLEYAVNSTKKLRKLDITVLDDLNYLDKLNPLKNKLLTIWKDLVFHDKGMKWRDMNHRQRERMLYYLDATNWQTFTKMQRKRAKERFRELYGRFCTSTTQTDVLELLTKKLHHLEAKTCYPLRNFSGKVKTKNESGKMLPFTHLDKHVKSNKNHNENIPKKVDFENVKTVPKIIDKNLFKIHSKKCRVCSKDISHKKANAVFCSKRCNNSHQAHLRKQARHKLKKSETENLSNVLERLDRSRLCLLVEYRHQDISEAFTFHQREINAPPEWARRTIKATILRNKGRTRAETFTSHRAKRLIREISKLNDKRKNNNQFLNN